MVADILENFKNKYKKNGEDGLVWYYCDKNKMYGMPSMDGA